MSSLRAATCALVFLPQQYLANFLLADFMCLVTS
jgi:hypothetical protein